MLRLLPDEAAQRRPGGLDIDQSVRIRFTDQSNGEEKTLNLSAVYYSVYRMTKTESPRLELYVDPTGEDMIVLRGHEARGAHRLLNSMAAYGVTGD